MQLEEGKFYRTRNGCVVGPLEKNPDEYLDGQQWRTKFGKWSYFEDGGYDAEKGKSEHDLVGEVRVVTGDVLLDKDSALKDEWRRIYAGQAMQAMISFGDSGVQYDREKVPTMAVEMADALLAKLEEPA